MRDGLPAGYDAWRTAYPPEWDLPYTWDCPVCGEEGIGEDEKCPQCHRDEEHDKWYCDDCRQDAWVGEECYSCGQTEAEQEEKGCSEEEDD